MSEIYCGQATKYLVNLTDDERARLEAMLNKGTGPARPLTRARILLAADRNDPDEAIAYALHVHRTTDRRRAQALCRTGARRGAL